MSQYNPHSFDYGISFMGTTPLARGITLQDGDDYNLPTDVYGPSHVSGYPQHGWVSITNVTGLNHASGVMGVAYPPDQRIAGSNSIANLGLALGGQREWKMDLSLSGAPDTDGTRTFAILSAVGRPGIAAPNTTNYVQLLDGLTVKATVDGNPFTELDRLAAYQYGGTAQKGFPETLADTGPLGAQATLSGWVNNIRPEVFKFSGTMLSLKVGSPIARLNSVSAITYIRVRRVRPSTIPQKATWEHNMHRFGHWFKNSQTLTTTAAGGLPIKAQNYPDTADRILGLYAGNPNNQYIISSAVQIWEQYYDALRVWTQIYNYTGDADDRLMAEAAFQGQIPAHMRYDVTNGSAAGGVQALSNFTTGYRLYRDLLLSENGGVETVASLRAKQVALAVSHKATYANDDGWSPGSSQWTDLPSASQIRECAYSLTGKCDAELLGEPRSLYLTRYRDFSLGHIQSICVDKTFRSTSGAPTASSPIPGPYYQKYAVFPFMMSNCMVGLIRYAELMMTTGEGAAALALVLPAVRTCIDYLWTYCWIPNIAGFSQSWTSFGYGYLTAGNANPPGAALPFTTTQVDVPNSPWLNLLVVQPWGWYYHRTGNTTIRDQGDVIFAGGVAPNVTMVQGWWNGGPKGKNFNQHMVKSFDYVRWRDMAVNLTSEPDPDDSIPHVPSAPTAPSGLTLAAPSSTTMTLSWTDNSNNETGFKIERAVVVGVWTQVGTVGANITTYTDTGLTASTSYSYQVRATNAVGDSAYSGAATGSTQSALLPNAPSSLTATTMSTTAITINWTDNSSIETTCKIERALGAGSLTQVATVGPNVTTYANTGLASSTAYSYRVRASNVDGDSSYSNTASATTQTVVVPTAPTAPSGLVATAISTTEISLSWTDNSNNETSFEVEGAVGAGAFGLATTVGENITTVTRTGRAPSTTYSYRVRATNAVGNSAYSNTATATTQAVPTAILPTAPSGLTATAASASAITLTWVDNSAIETGYKIERALEAGAFGQIVLLSPNVTTYVNTGLVASTAYSYRVRATNAVGDSTYSNTATDTTDDGPPPVDPPTGAGGGCGPRLSWRRMKGMKF